jgi:DNA segregation ATPase FtsK/SpoIIIE-like protein
MVAMSPTALPSAVGSRPRGFSRRTLLAASAAGLALLATGCSSSTDEREQVTTEQADELAAQVAVQEALVAAIAAAGSADPALAAAVTDLATEAEEQLQRLKAAAPGGSATPSSAATPPGAPDARAWLRGQVSTAATSHAAACLDQSGARAALLGSIAAGLRGHDGRLA